MCIFSKYELLGKKIKLSSYKISGVRLEDQMVGWHHRLNGYDFEQAPGIGDGQERRACYSPWGSKESDTSK